MQLSYVILTHNRRDTLLRTLRVLVDHTPLERDQWEAIVVDNASTDGTAEAVRRAFAEVRIVQRQRNEGSPARNAGVRIAEGEYIAFLDDDSYPCGDTVTRSMQYMQRHKRVGLIGGRVLLPDGNEDAAALPIVMPACALCARREALLSVGGFSPDFFRQAEEYDLVFRLLAAGWDVQRLDDLVYRHEKVTISRSPALIQQLDLRNNLLLVERYLPRELRRVYRRDWLRRYIALANHAGNESVVAPALAEARLLARRERRNGRSVLDAALVEAIFQLDRQAQAVAEWARAQHARRVVIADYSKNLYATWRACRLAGLKVLAICDDSSAFGDLTYRGAAVISDAAAMLLQPDGIVVSNINPGRVDARISRLGRRFDGPILRLWSPRAHADVSPQSPQHEHDRWQRSEIRLAV